MDKITTLLSLAYHDGLDGGVCGSVSIVIRSQEECIAAVKSLEFRISSSWTGAHMNYPSGCSVRNSDKKLYFEKSQRGVGKGKEGHIPICKGAYKSSGLKLLLLYSMFLMIYY